MDRMKIGFMMAEENLAQQEAKETSQQSPPHSPEQQQQPTNHSNSLKRERETVEEEDENGVIILSTFISKSDSNPSKESSSPPPENIVKIPSISTLNTNTNSNSNQNSNHNIHNFPTSLNYISYDNGARFNFKPKQQQQQQHVPPPFQMSPSKQIPEITLTRDIGSQPYNLSIPNFNQHLNSNANVLSHDDRLNLSPHSYSPKQDSMRTTPTSGSSVSSSPFLTPRNTELYGGGSHLNVMTGSGEQIVGGFDNCDNIRSVMPLSPGGSCGSDDECSGDRLSPTFGPRSLACNKHSKWKKRCPDTCVGRVSPVEFPTTTRKLWSQDECCRLLEMVFQKDPQSVTSKESEQRWRAIANSLGRTVTSTRKKYMRLMNKWSPRPSMTSSVHPISKLIENNERKRKGFEMTNFPAHVSVKEQKVNHLELQHQQQQQQISPHHHHHQIPHQNQVPLSPHHHQQSYSQFNSLVKEFNQSNNTQIHITNYNRDYMSQQMQHQQNSNHNNNNSNIPKSPSSNHLPPLTIPSSQKSPIQNNTIHRVPIGTTHGNNLGLQFYTGSAKSPSSNSHNGGSYPTNISGPNPFHGDSSAFQSISSPTSDLGGIYSFKKPSQVIGSTN